MYQVILTVFNYYSKLCRDGFQIFYQNVNLDSILRIFRQNIYLIQLPVGNILNELNIFCINFELNQRSVFLLNSFDKIKIATFFFNLGPFEIISIQKVQFRACLLYGSLQISLSNISQLIRQAAINGQVALILLFCLKSLK